MIDGTRYQSSVYSHQRIMISSPFSLFSLFSLTTIFVVFFFSDAVSSGDIIQETCKKSAERDPNLSYGFCIASLQSDDRSRVANLHKLGLISMDLLRHNVTSTRRDVKTLLRNKKLDQFTKACLDDCLELYSDAVPTLKQAKRDYRAKKYADANSEISSVMEAPSTCENGFQEKEGVVSPLTKRNSDAFQLAAMTLSIINMNMRLQ